MRARESEWQWHSDCVGVLAATELPLPAPPLPRPPGDNFTLVGKWEILVGVTVVGCAGTDEVAQWLLTLLLVSVVGYLVFALRVLSGRFHVSLKYGI